MEIYAPIAERMGMQEIRSELDEICFEVIEPSVRETIVKRLNLLRSQDENILKKTARGYLTWWTLSMHCISLNASLALKSVC